MSRLDEMVEATPASRDRVVDFLRAASIVAVVIGHWFIGLITWQDGILRTQSAVGRVSWLWAATWVFQVMPVFFFVGGFSNMVSLDAARRRGTSTGRFVRNRLERLVRPSIPFFLVWAVVTVILHLTNTGAPTGPRLWGDTTLLRLFLPPGATLPFGPLWFLAVYAAVVALAPWLVSLHRRFRWWVPVAMIAGTVLADLVGFIGGLGIVRWLNVAFVLLLPHQLGFFYADGTVDRLSRKVYWAMVGVGLAGLILLTNPQFWRLFGDARFTWFPGLGRYPRSLLGTDVERVSNAYPPTICFLLGGVLGIGIAMLLRPRLTRWLQTPGPWKTTIFLNSVIMTLFLWHMTAFLLAILVMWPLGLGHDALAGSRWWVERVLWLAVPAAFLVGLVAIFGRFERPRPRTGASAG
jgi:hypothetical protein